MERFRTSHGLVLGLVLGLAGCGQAGSSDVASKPATPVANNPSDAVRFFLEAVKHGDDQKAGAMLTELARRKTREVDMVVSPPGSDTATFEIGEVQMVDPATARVACSWTDMDHQGKSKTDHIVWMVREVSGDWGISGMMAQIFPDRPPVVLNFENPEDMMEQQQLAEEEAVKRANQQDSQASKPSDPFQSKSR